MVLAYDALIQIESRNKGQFKQFNQLLVSVVKASGPTIPCKKVKNTSKATLAALDSLIHGKWIQI